MFKKIIRNQVVRKVIIKLMGVLSLINMVLPKDEHRILIYDGTNKYLIDNSEALFKFLLNNEYYNSYKIVTCIPGQVSGKHKNYRNVGSFAGVLYFMVSKYVFFSFGDMRIAPSKSQVVVNLWHGMPLKRIGKLTTDGDYVSEKLDNFTMVNATSKLFAPIISAAFGCEEKKVFINGECRNDLLFSHDREMEKVGIDPTRYKKTVIWMPTFRISSNGRFKDIAGDLDSETGIPILNTIKDYSEFDKFLSENDVLVIVKSHRAFEIPPIEATNIKFIDNDKIYQSGSTLYSFMSEFDALITDYSSVFFDFLLLNRPIGFTLDDFDMYKKGRGLVFDNPLDYMPGAHIYSYDELCEFISNLNNQNDAYIEARIKVNDEVNTYKDNRNCERLLSYVGVNNKSED